MKTKSIRIVLIVVAIAGLCLVGGYGAYRGYVHLRQTRLLKQARTYLEKSKARQAQICLQRVLRSDPKNVEACRLMAELNEAARSSGALFWRSRVVELKPRSVKDRLALAQAALMLRDYATATNALEAVDAAGKKTAPYHNLAGTVAAALKQLPQAEAHLLEAARLEPTNTVPQLNLAVVRLQGTNAQVLAEARTVLQRLSANPTNGALRCQALRELVVDALRFKHGEAALALSQELLRQTNAAFTDRLLRLTVLRETRNAEFPSALANFQHEATQGTNAPARIYELATWQLRTGKNGTKEALTWLNSLPWTTQTNLTVALLMAECQITLQNWGSLQAFLDKQYWAELEFLRHAFKARSLRGQDLAGAAKGEWELALKTANRQQISLVMLLRLADQWNWPSEKEELLWSIVDLYPNERWAFSALIQTLYTGGRTRPLMMLCSRELQRNPSNVEVKNNLAMTALLLEANELKPHDLAREVYQLSPTNASYAATYAFSLHLQKKDADALKVMQQLKPRELDDPAIAGYYGLVLQATGNREKARVYLQWAAKAQLLPEEKQLFDRTRAGG